MRYVHEAISMHQCLVYYFILFLN